jgi:hypothetical protein
MNTRSLKTLWDPIAKEWRDNLAGKLQERYGLSEGEARKKADVWLQWVRQQSPQTLSLERNVAEGALAGSRQLVRDSKSRTGVPRVFSRVSPS